MEELIRELIDSINNLNKFSWSDAISILSLIGAWITIIILIIKFQGRNMGCINSKKQILPIYIKTNTNDLYQSIQKKNKNEPFSLVNFSTNNLCQNKYLLSKKLSIITLK